MTVEANLTNFEQNPFQPEKQLSEALFSAAYSGSGSTEFGKHRIDSAKAFEASDTLQKLLPDVDLVALDPGECRRGEISHYGQGDGLYGQETASGEILQRGAPTMALPDYNNATDEPYNVVVENLENGQRRTLRVNDMGPAVRLNRTADIESANFRLLSPNRDLFQGRVCRPRE